MLNLALKSFALFIQLLFKKAMPVWSEAFSVVDYGLPPGELHRLWFILGYFDMHDHQHK